MLSGITYGMEEEKPSDDTYVGLQPWGLLAGIAYMFNPEFKQLYAMGEWADA
jgi:hypothetical protein